MKEILFLFACFLASQYSTAQYFQASVNENLEYTVQPIQYPVVAESRQQSDEFQQIPSFPRAFPVGSNIKNFRNVTLEDLDDDGVSEIIFAAKDKLIAFSKGEILWEKSILGYGIYPPSIADLDQDGRLEIVQVTGGPCQPGHVYLMDAQGNDWEGWPQTYEEHWILTAPTLSDLDEDGIREIIFLERINSMVGQIHAVRLDGSLFNNNWPIPVPGTPAVTPSVGDVDNDGEKEIIVYTTSTMYQFDLEGDIEPGWPVENSNTRFSFQAPLLRDLDGDGDLEIIGATHGDLPEYYVLHHDGTPYNNWPQFVPQRSWTFSSPTIIEHEGEPIILMSRPHTVSEGDVCVNKDMLYAWNEAGEMVDGFPIEKIGGLESGIITVADIDEAVDNELIFGSNAIDETGNGFIHAYKMNGTGELAGFPLRPRGWTLSNGAALGDVTGDGNLNLIALSYTLNFGAAEDSLFLNVYDLKINHLPENLLWNTFKGDNTREGVLPETAPITSIKSRLNPNINLEIYPNPFVKKAQIRLILESAEFVTGELFHGITGQRSTTLFASKFPTGESIIPIEDVSAGFYILKVTNTENKYVNYKLLVLNN